MAAGDIALNAMIATVECDEVARKITLDGAACSLVNIGVSPVYITKEVTALHRDGLQHDGEIELLPDDSIPLPADAAFVRHQCAAGLSTKLWYIPSAG